MHMVQTAGLALAADRANDDTRPRVVAMLYILHLCGMGISALIVGFLLGTLSGFINLVRVANRLNRDS